MNTSPNAKTVVISLPPMPSAEPEKVKARITEIAKERVPDADQVIINLTL